MMCWCRSISCNKCTILVSDVDNGGSSAYVGAGGLGEISVSSSQLCCEHKTAVKSLQKKNLKKKRSWWKLVGSAVQSLGFDTCSHLLSTPGLVDTAWRDHRLSVPLQPTGLKVKLQPVGLWGPWHSALGLSCSLSLNPWRQTLELALSPQDVLPKKVDEW